MSSWGREPEPNPAFTGGLPEGVGAFAPTGGGPDGMGDGGASAAGAPEPEGPDGPPPGPGPGAAGGEPSAGGISPDLRAANSQSASWDFCLGDSLRPFFHAL